MIPEKAKTAAERDTEKSAKTLENTGYLRVFSTPKYTTGQANFSAREP
jgi:hypothetical protein